MPQKLRVRLRRLGECRGQSMVEFALILPVLALVLFGCIQVGLSFFSYEQVAAAANHGARAAAGNRAGDPTAAARAAARSTSPSLHLTDGEIAVTYNSTAATPGTAWSYPGTTTVTVTHPLSITLFGLFSQSIDLKATATKRVER